MLLFALQYEVSFRSDTERKSKYNGSTWVFLACSQRSRGQNKLTFAIVALLFLGWGRE